MLSHTLQYPRLFKYNYTAAITFAMLLLPIHLCEHADIPESPLLQLRQSFATLTFVASYAMKFKAEHKCIAMSLWQTNLIKLAY